MSRWTRSREKFTSQAFAHTQLTALVLDTSLQCEVTVDQMYSRGQCYIVTKALNQSQNVCKERCLTARIYLLFRIHQVIDSICLFLIS